MPVSCGLGIERALEWSGVRDWNVDKAEGCGVGMPTDAASGEARAAQLRRDEEGRLAFSRN